MRKHSQDQTVCWLALESHTPYVCGPWISQLVLLENQRFSTWRWVRTILIAGFEKYPLHFDGAAENELRMRKCRLNVADSKKKLLTWSFVTKSDACASKGISGFCNSVKCGWRPSLSATLLATFCCALANVGHWPNVVSMSGERRRRQTTLGHSHVVVGLNESMGFRLPLCRYKLNWAMRTSWGWCDERYDIALQTQDSKFDPWRLRSSSLPLGHGGSPQYWIFASEQRRNILFLWNLKARERLEPAISDFPRR